MGSSLTNNIFYQFKTEVFGGSFGIHKRVVQIVF